MSAPKASDLRARMRGVAAAGRPAEATQVPAPARPPSAAERRVRITVDLSVDEHRGLRMFAAESGTDASSIIRTLLELLQEDPQLRATVADRAQRRSRRAPSGD